MTRRQAREVILKALFQYDFTGKKLEKEAIKSMMNENKNNEALDFISDIVSGTIKNIKIIDKTIQAISINWELTRLTSVDRTILRFSTYELLFRDDIPPRVTINEAVDIAKKYSTSESYSFVNGVLDKIAKTNIIKS